MDASLATLEENHWVWFKHSNNSEQFLEEYMWIWCQWLFNHLLLFKPAISLSYLVGSLRLIVIDEGCSSVTNGVLSFTNLLLSKFKRHSYNCLLRRDVLFSTIRLIVKALYFWVLFLFFFFLTANQRIFVHATFIAIFSCPE